MAMFNFKQKKNRTRKSFKHDDSPERQRGGEQDLPAMIRKMQQQLNFLEKKIDTLLGQSQGKPFRQERHPGRFSSGAREESTGERRPYKGQKPFPPRRRPKV